MSNTALSLDICEEHTVEASFLWLLRDQAVCSSIYSPQDVAQLDERIEAHLDGLRLAGDIGWQAADENMSWQEAGEIFTGTAIAFSIGKKQLIDKVLEAGSKSVQSARGVISGMGWINNEKVMPFIKSFVQSEEPLVKRIGIGACAVLRQNLGDLLDPLINSDNNIVSARALKAAGELGRVDLLSSCTNLLSSDDEACRFWAAWSSSLLGDSQLSTQQLMSIAEQAGIYSEQSCDLAARRLDIVQAQDWLKELGNNPQHHRLAVVFAGAIGMPVLVPWLMNMMTVPELARKAGESFSYITGADLVDYDLAGDEPDGFDAGPTEDPKDEMVAIDPDEDLPWPDVNLVAQWWAQYKDRYSPHQRYLLGYPVNEESLNSVLKNGRQSNRFAAALELSLMNPNQQLIEVRAPIFSH